VGVWGGSANAWKNVLHPMFWMQNDLVRSRCVDVKMPVGKETLKLVKSLSGIYVVEVKHEWNGMERVKEGPPLQPPRRH